VNPAIAARWLEIAPLLDRALDLPADAREAFLQEQVTDTSLRALLQDLLARESRRGFLDGNSADYAESLIATPLPAQPQQIGAYRVLDLIGEGGSGSVYRAEREADGYTQRVALKLLRSGTRDPAEQARFRRERRILARLEHPAIARLIDGGFTADGVPWFALEYVEGENILRWCDARRLDVAARLRLFLVVCDAVEAAHRALIVHRDIKPANILVDGEGRPRLLDFGIAKLLDDTEHDDETRTGLRRLTPAYAAPEQFSGGAVTTATDVYALGVLLHELLSGQRPQLRGGEPRALSQSATQDDTGTAAAARTSSPRQLARSLRGDLDVIVATALAAEPQRRYAGVAALAADLRAHLQGRPIAARRAGTGYRVKKFLLRHRIAVAAAALVLLTALAGLGATWRESRRANAAAQEALQQAQRAAAVKDFVLALFAGVSPDEAKGRDIGARELLERGEARLADTLAARPELKAELATALAAAYRQLGVLERARSLADSAVQASPRGELAVQARLERARVALAAAQFHAAQTDLQAALADAAGAQATDAHLLLVDLYIQQGKPDAARQALAAAMAGAQLDSGDAARLRDLAALGPVQFRAGDVAGAETSLREALRLARAQHGERHTQTARIAHDLAVILLQRGAAAEAAELLATAETTRRELLGDSHPDYAQTVFNLAVAKQRLGDSAAAGPLYERALAIQQRSLGADHPDTVSSLNSLALLAWSQGDSALAITRLGEALAAARRRLGAAHPTVATMLGTLSGFERYAGRLDAALAHGREGLQAARTALGERHYLVGVALVGVAASQNELGDSAGALVSYREGLDILDAALGPGHADTLQSRAAYADALLAQGDRAAAEAQITRLHSDLGDSLPAGNPRRARLELVGLRAQVAAGGCAQALPGLQAAAASLPQGGPALLPDLASAQLLVAQCLRLSGTAQAARSGAAQPTQDDVAGAAQARAAAEATLGRLPYVGRRLGAERVL
jgi:eukaryotic-like serine/threonine-protein kinase